MGGGAEICEDPGVTPSKIKNSSDLGSYFLEGPHFANEKNRTNTKKVLIWGLTQIAAGDTMTSKFEPHGLQRSPKGPICSSSGVSFSSRGP